jgi:hypothetical protein
MYLDYDLLIKKKILDFSIYRLSTPKGRRLETTFVYLNLEFRSACLS